MLVYGHKKKKKAAPRARKLLEAHDALQQLVPRGVAEQIAHLRFEIRTGPVALLAVVYQNVLRRVCTVEFESP